MRSLARGAARRCVGLLERRVEGETPGGKRPSLNGSNATGTCLAG